MPVDPWVLTEHGQPFITLAADRTLGEALETLIERNIEPNRSYLVAASVSEPRTYQVGRFSQLGEFLREERDLLQPIGLLPLNIPHEIIPYSTPETGNEIVDRLLFQVEKVFLITDGDEVVGVLDNPHFAPEIVKGPSAVDKFKQFDAQMMGNRPVAKLPPVLFTTYYPAQALPNVQYYLRIYTHLASAAQDIANDVSQIVIQALEPRQAAATAMEVGFLEPGTLITAMPVCEHLEFDPVSITKKWQGEWIRFDFRFTVPQALVDRKVAVRVSIRVEGVEIARNECAISVIRGELLKPNDSIPNPPGPIGHTNYEAARGHLYKNIFISYSNKDGKVVRAYYRAKKAAGIKVFMDTECIRAGDNFEAALIQAIHNAEIFHLFWSKNAAASPRVRQEWEYCLREKCPQTRCVGFILPVYWEDPKPTLPPELRHLERWLTRLDNIV